MQKLFEKHHEMMRRQRENGFEGFTLIELLIVIVVLGILAATVIFALGGVTSQSAQAACQSDAKSIETAMEAYHSFPGNSTNAYPTQVTDLVGGTYGQFLHAMPNNTHYYVALYGDGGAGGDLAGAPAGTALPGGAAKGHVYVGPPGTTLVDYDTESSTTGCGAAS